MKLHCDITLPASKSESNRALMIAAYGGFASDFQNLSDSIDTLVLKEALQCLPSIDSILPTFQRRNDIEDNQHIIDIADCGTAARFMTTYLACHEGDWLLTGTERMKQRPIAPLVDALRVLGAVIQYVEKEGYLPLQINGKPLLGGKVSIDMTQSSQFASSLLLAAPMWPQGLEIELLGELSSLPYLEMTLAMMRHFGAEIEQKVRVIKVLPKPYQSRDFTVGADWSAASYWYEMAAFSEDCEIKLRGLSGPLTGSGTASLQGDAIVAEWMTQLGVGTFVENDAIVLRKIPFGKCPLSFDFSQHPDLYPTMAAICAGLHVEATFTGLDNLALKESDRVEAMQTELKKIGQHPLCFCAHNDHRIVMALAPLSMLFGAVSFDHPEVVEKSYPSFWKDVAFLPVKR
jgi:3-phosphoshikimate 1-carboxyvinyltransferase